MSESDGELSVGMPSPVSDKRHDGHRFGSCHAEEDVASLSDDSQSTNHTRVELNDNSTSDSNGIHRNPTCALCRNHQRISTLKGHKRYCPFRQCLCELCYSTNKKREVNAKQVALRRAQAQDEAMGLVDKDGSPRNAELIGVTPAKQSAFTATSAPAHGVVKSKTIEQTSPSLREDAAKRLNCPTPSAVRASAALPCQPGPVVFGHQLSLGSIILCQNASMLRESMGYSRLGPEMLSFLEHVIHEAKVTTEDILLQLNEIQKELQVRFLREQVVAHPSVDLASYSSLPFSGQEALPRPIPVNPTPVHQYNVPMMYQSQFRATVISAPRLDYHNSLFNPHPAH